jgi:hypothetical protein
MYHSFGPASGGTGQLVFQVRVCKYKPWNPLPFSFSISNTLDLCSVVEQQEGAG